MPNTVKLAEALLRRKELQQKVDQVRGIKAADVYQVHTKRTPAHEGLDDVIAQVPQLTLSQVTAEYDYYAKQLRLVDAAIQHANWTVEVEVGDSVMADFPQPTK